LFGTIQLPKIIDATVDWRVATTVAEDPIGNPRPGDDEFGHNG
jgi:hypothetical protein